MNKQKYSQIKTKTFYNRMHKCAFYKEEYNYANNIRNFFKKVIIQYKNNIINSNEYSFYDIFINEFNERKFTGERNIYIEDTQTFKETCVAIAYNINKLLNSFNIERLGEEYIYKGRIWGSIGGVITVNSKTYTLDFSFDNIMDTYSDIGFHKFNLFLFNNINHYTHNLLVFNSRSYQFFKIPYSKIAYTMKYGYIPSIIKSRSYNPGPYCEKCSVKNCKPLLINDIERI